MSVFNFGLKSGLQWLIRVKDMFVSSEVAHFSSGLTVCPLFSSTNKLNNIGYRGDCALDFCLVAVCGFEERLEAGSQRTVGNITLVLSSQDLE